MNAKRNRWLVGNTVLVDLHGTDAEGTVKRAPIMDDSAWCHADADFWIVDIDGEEYRVLAGRVR